MSVPLPPLKQADMPLRQKSFWRMTGPGAILVGLSIGAAEIIVWPWITAQFGAVMAWAAVVGVFLQLWVNIEIGRWAVATGESTYTAYARMWIGYIHFFLFLGFISMLLPGWARISGSALKALLLGPQGGGPDWMWTLISFAGVALVLFGPKTMYTAVEVSVTAMVLLIVAGLAVVAFQVGNLQSLGELFRGVVNFGHIELNDQFSLARFFGAMVYAGGGGSGNLWYAFYLRDKNIGMGGRIPKLLNPLQKGKEEDVITGFTFPETDENKRRFRDWFRYVLLDQTLYFLLLNLFTIFLFMFAALAVLRPAGVVPAEGRLVWDEAIMLSKTMGVVGHYLFLVIGMAALFSTQLVVVDGASRAWAYMLNSNFRFARRWTQNQWYLRLAVFFMLLGTGSTWLFDHIDISGLDFLFNVALLSGIVMAIYVPLTLYANLKYLPRSARPGPLNVVMMAIASLVYISFCVYLLWDSVF